MSLYEASYYQDREAWPDFRAEMAAILGLANLRPESRVLELGCGSGELLRRLRARARWAVGVDLSPAGLRLSRQKNGLLVVCAPAEALPFPGGTFDALMAQHLVEHIPEPDAAMREWRRVLRPGGTLVLLTPNAGYRDPAHFQDPGHCSLFTPATLRSTLESAGFRVIHLSTLFPYLGRGRLARAASIRLAALPRHIPGLAESGRSLVVAAARD